MSKAILVIDIPDFVNTVTKGILKPIGAVGKLEIGYGSDDGEMVRFEFINIDGALLKPIPKKVKSASEYGSDEVYIKHLINWKKEIDEILGEENE